MAREEVEFMPSGLVTCFINDVEARILKISPEGFTFRVSEKIQHITSLNIVFYSFDDYRYKELKLEDYTLLGEDEEEFYVKYRIAVNDSVYINNVKGIFKDYTKYIMLKNFGYENEFSEAMVGYPAEEDENFYVYYDNQKKDWMDEIIEKENFDNIFEMAIKIDNHILYNEYLRRDIKSFREYYYKVNYIKSLGIFNKGIDRIYIGNEFCHNLFPKEDMLIEILEKSLDDRVEVTVCFTYLRENYIDKNRKIIESIYSFCVNNKKQIEIVINDWGMLSLIKNKEDYLKPVLGVLLNKRKKDPRYNYKKGYDENKHLIGKNSLNSSSFREFLKERNIQRYEYESCGYKMGIAEGKHSLQIPFYVTNLSQYCPLNAVCKTGDRGRQRLVKCCAKYCTDYVFMYPKHLKMIGRYNSLFAFDDTLLKDDDKLKEYLDEGIDRIVLNFI